MRPGVFFIPYRDRAQYDETFLATLLPVVIGRGFDQRLLGYTVVPTTVE